MTNIQEITQIRDMGYCSRYEVLLIPKMCPKPDMDSAIPNLVCFWLVALLHLRFWYSIARGHADQGRDKELLIHNYFIEQSFVLSSLLWIVSGM